MNPRTPAHPSWSTASFGDSTQPSPLELMDLGDHLGLCKRLNSRRAALRSGAQTMQRFVVAHFMTTLVGVTLAGSVVWLVL